MPVKTLFSTDKSLSVTVYTVYTVYTCINTAIAFIIGEGKFSYSAISIQSSGLLKAFYTLLPWQTCLIKHHHAATNARRLLVQISTLSLTGAM